MRASLVLVALAATVGCSDLPSGLTSGHLQVAVGTTGGDIDLDGYGLAVDGVPVELALGVSDTSLVAGVPAGPHDVELTGVAENCAVTGGTSRAVTLDGGDTARVVFPIVCSATGVFITASTTGIDLDTTGYRISLDGGPDTVLGTSLTVTRLGSGEHTIALGDLAGNCVVAGENPRTVTVQTGTVTPVLFTVTCTATSGIVSVTAATTGLDLPAASYTVGVDDQQPQPLSPNGTLNWGQLEPGEHSVTLSGVPGNCTVAGDNPRLVTVTGGGPTRETATTTFEVACVTATGVIAITTVTSGIDLPDSNGYSIVVGGATPEPLALNGTLIRSALPGGDYTLALTGVPDNCAVAGDNPRTLSVSVGGTTRDTAQTTFQIGCVAATGALAIEIITSGEDFDLDGYRVRVDSATQNVGIIDAIVTSGLPAADYSVTLEHVATNCQVDGSNPRTLSVTTGGATRDTARTTFTVRCVATDWIAFSRDGSIMVAIADGSSIATVAAGYDPAWSPDGSALAFAALSCYEDYYYESYCYRDGLVRTQDNGSGPVRLTANGSDADPTWHPDGTRIAFTRGQTLYVINADGSGLTSLALAGVAAHPAWSPDGERLAYTCQIADNLDVCVINTDGSDLVRLTSDPGRDTRPAWKPDGSQIVFTTTRYSGVHELAVMNADGSGITRVSAGTSGVQPAWSPDGALIAFSPFQCDLYSGCVMLGLSVIRPDGSGLTPITSGRDSGAAWRP